MGLMGQGPRRSNGSAMIDTDRITRVALERARDAMCPDGCGKGSAERPMRLPEDGFHYPALKCLATPIRILLAEMEER